LYLPATLPALSLTTTEALMENKNPQETIRIELNEEQKQQLRERTGQDANAIEFSVQELEERIAPTLIDQQLADLM
jgi:hypothetical protein